MGLIPGVFPLEGALGLLFWSLYCAGLVKSAIVFFNWILSIVVNDTAKLIVLFCWILLLIAGHWLALDGLNANTWLLRSFSWLWFGGFVVLTGLFLSRFIRDASMGREQPLPYISTKDITAQLHPQPSADSFKDIESYLFLRKFGVKNDFLYPVFLEHEIFLEELPAVFDGFSFLHLTDMHFKGNAYNEYYRQLAEWIAQLKPKLVLVTGDFVSHVKDIESCGRWFQKLTQVCQVVGVFGNHDYWTDSEHLLRVMKESGVTILVNRSLTFEKHGDKLHLVGFDDFWHGQKAGRDLDLWKLQGFKIGLAHTPDHLRILSKNDFNLQLSGHTHGGQVRFPLLGPVFVPSIYSRKYDHGFYEIGRMLLYVNQGIGGAPPVRIRCRPEVSRFILRKKVELAGQQTAAQLGEKDR